MIDHGHPRLSIVRQCELVSISRSSFYREPTPESVENLAFMRLIDEQFLEDAMILARGRWRGTCGALAGASGAIGSAGPTGATTMTTGTGNDLPLLPPLDWLFAAAAWSLLRQERLQLVITKIT